MSYVKTIKVQKNLFVFWKPHQSFLYNEPFYAGDGDFGLKTAENGYS